MDMLHNIIGDYYGLDWGVLFFGLITTVLMTQGNLRQGMKIGLLTCACGFTCALLSGQNGFIIYNLLLACVNIRGLLRGDRRGIAREVIRAANDDAALTQPVALARAHAR